MFVWECASITLVHENNYYGKFQDNFIRRSMRNFHFRKKKKGQNYSKREIFYI